MATYDEVMTALRNADAAGDTEAANRLADMAKKLKADQDTEPIPSDAGRFNTGGEPQKQEWYESPWLNAAGAGVAAVPPTIAAARAAAWALRGRKGGEAAKNIAQAVTPTSKLGLAGEVATGALSGIAGYEAGQSFPEGWRRTTAEGIGGMAATLPLAGLTITRSLFKELGGIEATNLKELGNQASTWLGNTKARNAARTAIESNPNLVASIERGNELDFILKADLPALAKANGDTTISNLLAQQLANGKNAPFIAKVKQQYEAAEEAIRNARNGVAPTMQEVDAYVKQQALSTQRANEQARKAFEIEQRNRSTQIDALTERIRLEGAGLDSPGKQDTGSALKNLIEARRTVVQQQMSGEYERVLTEAEKRGVQIPGNVVAELRDFALDQKTIERFHSFPGLYKIIMTELSPKTVTSVSPKMAQKYTFDKAGNSQVTEPLDVRSIDSLKREVAAARRKIQGNPNESENYRLLTEFRDKLDQAINAADPEFRNAYRAVDEAYYKAIGIPYRNANGVLRVDRAKFIEDTVPTLTERASSLTQALDAMGRTSDAFNVASDAILYKLSTRKGIINDKGEINVDSLRRYLKDSADIVDQVPGLRQRIEGMATNVEQLKQARLKVQELQKTEQFREVENLWTQAYGKSGGIKQIVREALTNQQQLDGLLNITRQNPNALSAVRGAVLEDLITIPGNRLDVFKQNEDAMKKLFGPEGARHIEAIVEASQRIKDNPFKPNVKADTAKRTQFEERLGSKPEQIASDARNPVMSTFHAAAKAMSRFWQNQATKQEASEIQRMLLNIDELPKMAAFMEEYSTKGLTEKAMRIARTFLGNQALYLGGAVGGLAGGATNTNPDARINKPSDPALLEGFKR